MKIAGIEIKRLKTASFKASKSDSKKEGKINPTTINLTQGFKDRTRKDIDKWRQSLIMADSSENPSLQSYYDLVEDLLTDGHLQSQMQMRKAAILNTDFRIINDKGEEDIDLTTYIKKQWFFDFLSLSIDSIFFGNSLVEFQNVSSDNTTISCIPRQNVIPKLCRIIPNLEEGDNFINYNQPPYSEWIIPIGAPDNFGIINNIIPNLIWKRNVYQSWAEFCERFGLPLITATCNTANPDVVSKVHGMLSEIGESSTASFPLGTDIKLHEANRTDAYNVYKQFLQTNADEISKQILGSTILSDQGSNRSQTEVHERNLDGKIIATDKRFISFVINDQLLPFLRNHGVVIADNLKFEFKLIKPELSKNEMWQITSGLLDKGFDIDNDWISKTFEIPIPEKKKRLVTTNATASLDIIADDRYSFQCSCSGHITAVGNKISKAIDKLTNQAIDLVYKKKKGGLSKQELKQIDGLIGTFVATESKAMVEGLRHNFKTISPYTGPDLLALQMMEYNIFEFVESKVEARLAAMNDLLVDQETKQIRSFSEFEQLAQKEVRKYNRNWLQTEYNLSVAVGQTSAQYYRYMAEKDTVTNKVKYQTAGDSKVRSTHEALNGKIFSLDDGEAMDLLPPNGYGCRCEFIQYIGSKRPEKGSHGKALLISTDSKFATSQFNINRANLKQVFTKKQFYSDLKGLPEKLNKRTYDTYGLPDYSSIRKALKPLKLDDTITKSNFKELFKPVKGEIFMPFEDYMGRKMIITQKTFDNHTKGHYLEKNEQRHKLFPHIKNTLEHPDEVWVYEYEYNSFKTNYVKFHKDKVTVVRTSLQEKDGLIINTWFFLKNEEQIRRGLKIK